MLTMPRVHLNGTSKDELVRQLENACHAIVTAQAALAECAPNGRDYYPLGDGAINRASLEHAKRVAKLEEVREELQAIWEHVVG